MGDEPCPCSIDIIGTAHFQATLKVSHSQGLGSRQYRIREYSRLQRGQHTQQILVDYADTIGAQGGVSQIACAIGRTGQTGTALSVIGQIVQCRP